MEKFHRFCYNYHGVLCHGGGIQMTLFTKVIMLTNKLKSVSFLYEWYGKIPGEYSVYFKCFQYSSNNCSMAAFHKFVDVFINQLPLIESPSQQSLVFVF